MSACVGRYAPSPTGALHIGNLRTAVAAWASARHRGGRFLLRIEDLDQARCKPVFEERQLEDLRSLGLDWDEAPLRQSDRSPIYEEALEILAKKRLAYPCFCSRREIQEALSAPHGPSANAYPGTCRRLSWEEAQARISGGGQHSWRLKVDQAPPAFFDGFVGEVPLDLASEGGDFVIRRADGFFAYQLACAVDDARSGVTEVVRGDDLLDSGARQAYLLACLDLPVPRYLHLPLMHDATGNRLAKRLGSDGLEGVCQANQLDSDSVFSYLAFTLGQADRGEQIPPAELARRWDWAKVPRGPVPVREQDLHAFA